MTLRADLAGPVVIGGTGGSGTRTVARIVAGSGRFMGANVNQFGDALDLARFDWRWGLTYLRGRIENGGGDVDGRMATDHEESVRRHLGAVRVGPRSPWGWKHPHSYLMLPFLRARHPGLRFIHVVRDGRDMAFSSNQRQAARYGATALGAGWTGPWPVRSAAYWAWANTLARTDGDRLGDSYLCVRLEDLCEHPDENVRRVLAFAGTGRESARMIKELTAEVSPPESLARWRTADPDLAAAVATAAADGLRRFGYVEV